MLRAGEEYLKQDPMEANTDIVESGVKKSFPKISYAELSENLILSLGTYSDHSVISRIFSVSWYYLWFLSKERWFYQLDYRAEYAVKQIPLKGSKQAVLALASPPSPRRSDSKSERGIQVWLKGVYVRGRAPRPQRPGAQQFRSRRGFPPLAEWSFFPASALWASPQRLNPSWRW